jgi:ribosomal-protein-alanine N-acetyltransferase
VISENHTSVRLLEKNNFVKEAHFKEHSFSRGQYFDETVYSLLERDI